MFQILAQDILKQAQFDVLCLQEVERTDLDSFLGFDMSS